MKFPDIILQELYLLSTTQKNPTEHSNYVFINQNCKDGNESKTKKGILSSSLSHTFGTHHKNAQALPCSTEVPTYLRVFSSAQKYNKQQIKIFLHFYHIHRNLRRHFIK